MEGINIVGVQFRRAGRIYDFSAGDMDLRVGDDVVVETERGPSLAKVAQVRFVESKEAREKELRTIMRMATRRDLEEARKLTPEHATNFARESADRLGLKMTVLQSEVQFGGNKVIIYFSAPGRVDFRELVKELASGLKARVELKQVGARDEAKLVGGLGICGREFCCSSFLREFVPVSIKMAKNQNLALNPSKVSGGCGRLLCCLTYENDLYSELRRKLPPRGTKVRALEDGVVGDVIKGDLLNQVVVIETAEGRQITVPVKDLEILSATPSRQDDEETEADAWGADIDLEALAQLEDDGTGGGGGSRPRPGSGPGRGGRGRS
jgi:cell fate regulator YaaT (PSP1 superfamily)